MSPLSRTTTVAPCVCTLITIAHVLTYFARFVATVEIDSNDFIVSVGHVDGATVSKRCACAVIQQLNTERCFMVNRTFEVSAGIIKMAPGTFRNSMNPQWTPVPGTMQSDALTDLDIASRLSTISCLTSNTNPLTSLMREGACNINVALSSLRRAFNFARWGLTS